MKFMLLQSIKKINFIVCNADMTVTQNSEVEVTLLPLNACF